jgi:cytochrome c oxidase assembly factor CtaG
MALVYLVVVLLVLLGVGVCWAERRISSARRRGLYPPKGKITMDDVSISL